MSHIRKQLRDKVKTLLTPIFGSKKVFVNRTHAVQAVDLPCAIVTTDRDTREVLSSNSWEVQIELTVRVYEKAYSNVDDAMDALCVSVENAFIADTTISAQTLEINQTAIDIEDGDQPIAVATMAYTALFYGVSDPEQVI